jgi:hypothetical protein
MRTHVERNEELKKLNIGDLMKAFRVTRDYKAGVIRKPVEIITGRR